MYTKVAQRKKGQHQPEINSFAGQPFNPYYSVQRTMSKVLEKAMQTVTNGNSAGYLSSQHLTTHPSQNSNIEWVLAD